MKLWLIQASTSGYDVYDSAVVQAETEEAAKLIHPNGGSLQNSFYDSWVSNPGEVRATYLGESAYDPTDIVICSSFNAG